MKIVVFADSHTDVDTMRIVVKVEQPDMVIHLGDHVKDGIALHGLFSNLPMEFVKGNTDETYDYPPEKLVKIDGTRIFISHGYEYGVEDGGASELWGLDMSTKQIERGKFYETNRNT